MYRSKVNSVFSELKPLASVFDELINEGISNVLGASFATFGPNVNIVENKEGFIIELAVPGVTKSDFNMQLNQQSLTVSLKRDTVDKSEEQTFIRQEYRLTSFEKSFDIPARVDRNNITAKYENGVLYITLPNLQTEEKETSKTIEIV